MDWRSDTGRIGLKSSDEKCLLRRPCSSNARSAIRAGARQAQSLNPKPCPKHRPGIHKRLALTSDRPQKCPVTVHSGGKPW